MRAYTADDSGGDRETFFRRGRRKGGRLRASFLRPTGLDGRIF
jgi:hypothetical protein